MNTPQKDPRAVIEQLVEALKELDKDWREFNRTSYGLQGEATDDFYSLATTKAALTAGREALKLRTCTWTQHDDVHMPGTYETECGELWSFVEGGPSDNKTKFCHGCGGLVYEPVGINGLTEAETSASMSVLGLSKPTEPAPSTAGELPPLPSPVELNPASNSVMGYHEAHLKAYARAALLQSTHDERPVGELTEGDLMKCIAQAGCYGTVKLSYETEPYGIDEPTLNATKLARAILAVAPRQEQKGGE